MDFVMILGIGGNKVVIVPVIIAQMVVVWVGQHAIHPVVTEHLQVHHVRIIAHQVGHSLVRLVQLSVVMVLVQHVPILVQEEGLYQGRHVLFHKPHLRIIHAQMEGLYQGRRVHFRHQERQSTHVSMVVQK